MEIYVVTSGAYSDYGIEKVFLDKEKAEHYAEWGFDRRVETYNTDDDFVVEEIYKIHVHGRITYSGDVIIDCEAINKTNMADNNKIWFYESCFSWLPANSPSCYSFGFVKYIKNNNYSKQNLSDKYRKTYYDIAAIIKDHLAIGANEYEIDNMLKFYWEEDSNEIG